MSGPSGGDTAPRFISDARIRRMIANSIKRRRAKRQRELAAFVTEIREAERILRNPGDGGGDDER